MLHSYLPEVQTPVSLASRVGAELRRAIVLGILAAGEHLNESQLAQKFGVSRMPIREALARLEHDGLVRGEPHRGTFVVGMSPADVYEVYDVRRVIEVEAGRLAAARATGADLLALQQLVDEMIAAAEAGQAQLVARIDIAFHRHLVATAKHQRLLRSWEPLAAIAECCLLETDQVRDAATELIVPHQTIVDALKERDPEVVALRVAVHLREGARVMQGVIQEAAASRLVAASR